MLFTLLIGIVIVRGFLLHFSYLLLAQTKKRKKFMTQIVALPGFYVS